MAGMGMRPIMDLVVNHTAKDSPLVQEHPDWYLRDEKGVIPLRRVEHGRQHALLGGQAVRRRAVSCFGPALAVVAVVGGWRLGRCW